MARIGKMLKLKFGSALISTCVKIVSFTFMRSWRRLRFRLTCSLRTPRGPTSMVSRTHCTAYHALVFLVAGRFCTERSFPFLGTMGYGTSLAILECPGGLLGHQIRRCLKTRIYERHGCRLTEDADFMYMLLCKQFKRILQRTYESLSFSDRWQSFVNYAGTTELCIWLIL